MAMQGAPATGSTPPRVFNRHTHSVIPPSAVYIGRPSKWGNPFIIGRDGTRGQVIDKYRCWLSTQPELVASMKLDLRGKDLICFCSPEACHGNVILEIANSVSDPCTDPEVVERHEST